MHTTAVPNSSGLAPTAVPNSGGRALTGHSSDRVPEPAPTMLRAGSADAASSPASGQELLESAAAVAPPAGLDPAQLRASSKEHAPTSGSEAAAMPAAGPEPAPSLHSTSSSGIVASAMLPPSTSANQTFPSPTMQESPSLSPNPTPPSSPPLPATPPLTPRHMPTSSQETIVDDVSVGDYDDVASVESPQRQSHAAVLDPDTVHSVAHLFDQSQSSQSDSSEPVDPVRSRASGATTAVRSGPAKHRKVEIESQGMGGDGGSQGARGDY
jgi:hypothetical protein